MKYTISEEVCEKNSLKIEEVLAVLLVKSGVDISKLFSELEEKEVIVKDGLFNNYVITQRWDDVTSTILLDSDKEKQSPERLENLALKLMEIFPKQKKAGTCHYFRGNKKDITLRLKKFFKLYGNKYTDEQLINAAKKYVESFNGNYSYMRILKYFIWKDERKLNSDGEAYIEETSDLATFIENKDGENINNEWTVELR